MKGGGGQINPPQKKLPSKSPVLLGLTVLLISKLLKNLMNHFYDYRQ